MLVVPVAGAYVVLAGVALFAMVLMAFVRFPPQVAATSGLGGGRPLSVIMRQPVFIVACASAALGYGVMN